MSDNEIMEKLQSCIRYVPVPQKQILRDAIEFIERQSFFIDDLAEDIEYWMQRASYDKEKAIKDFAEKLKEIAGSSVAVNNGQEIYETKCYNIMAYKLDNLVNEMTESR